MNKNIKNLIEYPKEGIISKDIYKTRNEKHSLKAHDKTSFLLIIT